MNIDARRHLQYARGYIELGLFAEAAHEFAAIPPVDRALPDVLSARVDLEMAAQRWGNVVELARELAVRAPEAEQGWISWAYALRELQRVTEAKAVLTEAEPLHGATSATLHYNLACYHALLGELPEARMRLKTAFRMHPDFKQDATEDPDLERLWGEL